MNNKNECFHYTYSAAQQEEVEAIRKKYKTDTTTDEVDKMEQLRRLDARVTNKAMIPALTVGIIGALVMGFGMSLIMTDLGTELSMGNTMLIGVIVGIIGMVGVISAYPLYHHILEKERRKVAPQILELTEQLMQK